MYVHEEGRLVLKKEWLGEADRLDMTIAVDSVIKHQTKQTKIDKPLVVNIFAGTVYKSAIELLVILLKVHLEFTEQTKRRCRWTQLSLQ